MCLVCVVSDDVYFSGCAVLFPIELEGYNWLYDGFLPRLFYEPIRGMETDAFVRTYASLKETPGFLRGLYSLLPS